MIKEDLEQWHSQEDLLRAIHAADVDTKMVSLRVCVCVCVYVCVCVVCVCACGGWQRQYDPLSQKRIFSVPPLPAAAASWEPH